MKVVKGERASEAQRESFGQRVSGEREAGREGGGKGEREREEREEEEYGEGEGERRREIEGRSEGEEQQERDIASPHRIFGKVNSLRSCEASFASASHPPLIHHSVSL